MRLIPVGRGRGKTTTPALASPGTATRFPRARTSGTTHDLRRPDPRPWIAVLVAILAIARPAGTFASEPAEPADPDRGASGTRAPASPATGSLPTSVTSLAWMAGYWTSTDGDLHAEELWMAPRGGLLLGLHRDHRAGGQAFFEYLRIEETPEGVCFLASPKGRPAVPFTLVRASDREAVFEKPDHDFPQRIAYRRESDELIARVSDLAETRSSEWRWRRTETTGR